MDSAFLSAKFSAALAYEPYVATGTEEQQRRWSQVYAAAALVPSQHELAKTFVRRMHILVISGIWCGDCVQQVPLLQRIAEANPEQLSLRIVDRDAVKDLTDQLHINGGARVPVVLFLSEDFELCGTFGERTLSRYRAIAARQLGAACDTGIIAPLSEELAPVMQDWCNEVERMQLMLRISPRLRQLHGD